MNMAGWIVAGALLIGGWILILFTCRVENI